MILFTGGPHVTSTHDTLDLTVQVPSSQPYSDIEPRPYWHGTGPGPAPPSPYIRPGTPGLVESTASDIWWSS